MANRTIRERNSMRTQSTITEQEASHLIQDPCFGLDAHWREASLAQALAETGPFEGARCLSNAIRAFLSARETIAGTDRFLKLWTSTNALCGHIAKRFETAQAAHLGCSTDRLPARYRIQMIDNASIGALAALIDPAHPLPYFTVLHSQPFRDALHTLEGYAEELERECTRNPRGALAQLSEAQPATAVRPPCTGQEVHAFSENRTSDHPTRRNEGSSPSTQPSPATEGLFAIARELDQSPLVFVLLVASYQLRNGLIHGSIPLPLLPNEQAAELRMMGLCSLVLDGFLDRAIPVAAHRMATSPDGAHRLEETHRRTIARYLDHRFDGQGLRGILRKHGLFW